MVFMFQTPELRGTTRRASIANVIESEIVSGIWPTGARLPSEMVLMQTFKVSRETIRYALADLRVKGLIKSRHGIGHIVERCCATPDCSKSFKNITELVHYYRNTIGKFIKSEDIFLNETQAAIIGTEPNTSWRLTVTLRTQNGHTEPMGLNSIWVPNQYANAIQEAKNNKLPVFIEIQKQIGKLINRVRQVLDASFAEKSDAKLLQCHVHDPLLRIRRWYYLADQTLLGMSETLHPPTKFQYEMNLRHTPSEENSGAATE